MEITTMTYASSAPCVVDHRVALPTSWTAYGLEATRVLAPAAATVQGTGVSIAMRDRTQATVQAATRKATALLPISDVVDTNGFVGLAGSRSWSPPV